MPELIYLKFRLKWISRLHAFHSVMFTFRMFGPELLSHIKDHFDKKKKQRHEKHLKSNTVLILRLWMCSRNTFVDDPCLSRFNLVFVCFDDVRYLVGSKRARRCHPVTCFVDKSNWRLPYPKWTISFIILHSPNEYYNPLVNLWAFILGSRQEIIAS